MGPSALLARFDTLAAFADGNSRSNFNTATLSAGFSGAVCDGR